MKKTKEEVNERRRETNRIAARITREKKKQQLMNLAKENTDLIKIIKDNNILIDEKYNKWKESTNIFLENQSLKEQNAKLKKENLLLKKNEITCSKCEIVKKNIEIFSGIFNLSGFNILDLFKD